MSECECLVCRVPLGPYEACPSPSCPCTGMRSGSVEMDVAAERYGSPAKHATRMLAGSSALEILEHRAFLDYMAAAAP